MRRISPSRPRPPGRRKIVLATSIAETSLTIEGVRVVVDSGLMRVPVYEPDVGLTRLETVRVSNANADQRRGRAGRVEPGVCYRLWEEAANGGLQPYAAPEILSADLSGLMLDCAVWGVADPTRLAFLDSPPRGALAEARALLTSLGAVDGEGRITDEGRAIASLALPPRLARMVVDAAREGDARTASEVAVVLTERGLGGDSVDLTSRLEAFRRDRSQRADDARRLARGVGGEGGAHPSSGATSAAPFSREREKGTRPAPARGRGPGQGALLASAYPDRIAIARGRRGEFLMANGRAAALEAHDALAGEPFLAIGEIAGRAASARILLAAPLTLDDIEAVAGASIETADELDVRPRFRLLARAPPPPARRARARRADARRPAGRSGGARLGARRPFAWASSACRGPRPLKQWRDRVMFLRRAEGEAWPDLSDEALAADPGWLAPFLIGKTRLDEISADDLSRGARRGCFPGRWRDASTTRRRPTSARRPGPRRRSTTRPRAGRRSRSRSRSCSGSTSIRRSPGDAFPSRLQLLSPAHRPIQITRDLPGFWRGSWAAVRSDLRGRYPRHFWPEDPAARRADRASEAAGGREGVGQAVTPP